MRVDEFIPRFHPLRMRLFRCTRWDEVGSDHIIRFFEPFVAASSVNVNEYSTEMWDDLVPNIFTDEPILLLLSHRFSLPALSSSRKDARERVDGSCLRQSAKQPRPALSLLAFVLLAVVVCAGDARTRRVIEGPPRRRATSRAGAKKSSGGPSGVAGSGVKSDAGEGSGDGAGSIRWSAAGRARAQRQLHQSEAMCA
jgi:hypothetical protein